jgi:N-carbamoylputrescine amidase
MRVTVCQLHNEPRGFERDWRLLAQHVGEQDSQLVLLPEMPFYPWFAGSRPADMKIWRAAVNAHRAWEPRLSELGAPLVLASRPVDGPQGQRLNEAYVWEQTAGIHPVHTKYYLPEDDGYWEASWFDRGDGQFTPFAAGPLTLGFLICTELWFMQRARAYGKQAVNLLATPRASMQATAQKWLAGGRVAAVVSGAYSLSSNRISQPGDPAALGGLGWIIEPDGEVLAVTTPEQPFVTLEIDLACAALAKGTYPRYVEE